MAPGRRAYTEHGLKVDGTYRFAGTQQQVWDLLTDPTALQQCIPGCKSFVAIGNDSYDIVIEVGVAVVKGTYKGSARLANLDAPRQFTLIVEGAGGPGFVRGEGVLTLAEADSATTVDVAGDAQVGGMIAGIGQRLLPGLAKQMVGQFFTSMQAQLASRLAAQAG